MFFNNVFLLYQHKNSLQKLNPECYGIQPLSAGFFPPALYFVNNPYNIMWQLSFFFFFLLNVFAFALLQIVEFVSVLVVFFLAKQQTVKKTVIGNSRLVNGTLDDRSNHMVSDLSLCDLFSFHKKFKILHNLQKIPPLFLSHIVIFESPIHPRLNNFLLQCQVLTMATSITGYIILRDARSGRLSLGFNEYTINKETLILSKDITREIVQSRMMNDRLYKR